MFHSMNSFLRQATHACKWIDKWGGLGRVLHCDKTPRAFESTRKMKKTLPCARLGSQMPIVFYHSVVHGLGFFIWWVICMHGCREHRIHAMKHIIVCSTHSGAQPLLTLSSWWSTNIWTSTPEGQITSWSTYTLIPFHSYSLYKYICPKYGVFL